MYSVDCKRNAQQAENKVHRGIVLFDVFADLDSTNAWLKIYCSKLLQKQVKSLAQFAKSANLWNLKTNKKM